MNTDTLTILCTIDGCKAESTDWVLGQLYCHAHAGPARTQALTDALMHEPISGPCDEGLMEDTARCGNRATRQIGVRVYCDQHAPAAQSVLDHILYAIRTQSMRKSCAFCGAPTTIVIGTYAACSEHAALAQSKADGDLPLPSRHKRGSITVGIMFALAALASSTGLITHLAVPTPSPTISPLPSRVINYYAARGAQASGLEVALVRAEIDNESGGDPRAVSSAGAIGLMQLEAGTASDCGIHDRFNALANVQCGSRTLRDLINHYGSLVTAVAAYNFGSGNVDSVDGRLSRMPHETQVYVVNVIADYDARQHEDLPATAPTPAQTPAPRFHPTVPNLAMLVGVPAPQRVDPCAGRAWSFSHPMRFCGSLRVIPADSFERGLFFGNIVASVIDASRSAAGQRALFQGRGTYTLAGIDGYRSPAQAETDPFLKPFAGGGIAGYLLGFAIFDIGQAAVARDLPSMLGLRPLDQTSRDAILAQDIYSHTLAGANTWTPVLDQARHANVASPRVAFTSAPLPAPSGPPIVASPTSNP